MDRLKHLLGLLVALSAAMLLPAAADEPARRIVSLAPNVTELLYAAGAGPRVVGASEYSDYPDEARQLPRVGDAFRLDYEGILALRPDLVLAWESGTPRGAIDELRALGMRVVPLRVRTLEDIASSLEAIGALAGTPAPAAAAAGAFRREIAALRAEYARRPRVSVFVELDHRPLFTVTGRHVIGEMVSLCGGRNVFESLPGVAPAVDLEAVIAAAPQVILYTGPEADPAAHWQSWPGLPAVRHGNVMRLPADLVSRATPRAASGARAVCEAIDAARSRLPAGAH